MPHAKALIHDITCTLQCGSTPYSSSFLISQVIFTSRNMEGVFIGAGSRISWTPMAKFAGKTGLTVPKTKR